MRMDRHDEKKGVVVPLRDNSLKDKQIYVITFETGFRKGAGTTSKVSKCGINVSYVQIWWLCSILDSFILCENIYPGYPCHGTCSVTSV